jgi:hypothetical protein
MALDLIFLGTIEISAPRHENVQPSIAVVIDQAHAAAERFEDCVVVRFLAVVVGEVDSRFLGGVAKEAGASARLTFHITQGVRC